MLPSSERSKVRLDIEETDEDYGGLKSAYLELTLASGPASAKVLDLSEVGIGVRLAELTPDTTPSVGTLLLNTTIGTAQSRHDLGRLIVRRVELEDDGQVGSISPAQGVSSLGLGRRLPRSASALRSSSVISSDIGARISRTA